MSAALVRESLELVETSGKKSNKSKQGKSARGLHGTKNQDGTVQRKLKKTVATSSGVHLSIEELRMRLRVHEDRTEGNVRMLQKLGEKTGLEEDVPKKIFERAVKGKLETTQLEPKEEATVFTEEDFEKFEAEYFVN